MTSKIEKIVDKADDRIVDFIDELITFNFNNVLIYDSTEIREAILEAIIKARKLK